jgi:hypothetical protein
MTLKRIGFGFLCLLLISLAACTTTEVKTLQGTERAQVLQFAEPLADTYFSALNSGDYAATSHDWDQQMINAMPKSGFDNLLKTLTKVGKYQSRKIDHVEAVQNFYVVAYITTFEQDKVTVRLTFNKSDHKISGMWFDSPKLRQN